MIFLGAIGSYYNNDEKLNSVVKLYKLIKFLKKRNIFITLIGTILIVIGVQIGGNKSIEDIKQNDNLNTEKILSVLDLVLKDNFAGALHVFNAGDLQIKKGIIQELRNKALNDIKERLLLSRFKVLIFNCPMLFPWGFLWKAWGWFVAEYIVLAIFLFFSNKNNDKIGCNPAI